MTNFAYKIFEQEHRNWKNLIWFLINIWGSNSAIKSAIMNFLVDTNNVKMLKI